MNIDKYGLPVQADGDAADQLQRVGMIAIGQKLAGRNIISMDLDYALRWMLELRPGVYRRFYETITTNDVTGDQLIPVFAYWVLTANSEQLKNINWVFAQNFRKQGEPNVKTIPDFIFFRALPLLVRSSRLLRPLCALADSLLILAALTNNLLHRGPDDVDDNNLVITLCVCNAVKPTFTSRLASKLYKYTRAPSFGGDGPLGALRWYHRSDSGGNPEIAELYSLVITKYL